MASIHKKQRRDRKSSPYYYASFRGADGRQYFRSTKKTNEKEALGVAVDFERMARGVQTEAHYRRVAAEIYERTAGKPLNFHTCDQWLSQWLKNTKATVDERTYDDYETVLDDFRGFLGEHRIGGPLAAITPEDVTDFRDLLASRGLAPSTANKNVRKILSLPFEAARRLGYVTLNPCAAVKKLKETTAKSKRIRQAFTAEQIEALLVVARSDKWKDKGWDGVIVCGMTSAMRLSDIVNMTWEQVDLEKAIVSVDPDKKQDDAQIIPLHPAFIGWLKSQERGIGMAPVFPHLHGRKSGGANGLSRTFRRIMDEAEVHGQITRSGASAEKRKELGARAGRTITSLSFHSLRHSATSLMANAGVNADTRKAITGHSDDRVHAGYTHHEMKTLRAAVNKIAVPNSQKRK
jgi:integrase